MMYKTPVTMNEALELLAHFDQTYWTLYRACHATVMADRRRLDALKKKGITAPPLSATRKCSKALARVEAMTRRTIARMNAERAGAAFPSYDVAARLYCDARLSVVPEERDRLVAELTHHLAHMADSDWLGSDVISYKYGSDVSEGLARRLDMLGRYPAVVRCMMGWPDLDRMHRHDAAV